MGQRNPIKVQLLSVPDCPLVVKVRSTLDDCLTKTNADATVEELVGDYNSPTLLINGFDVTGRPPAAQGLTSCRLDLPNEEQILAAIRGLPATSCDDETEAGVGVVAFRILLRTAERVKVEHVSQEMGRKMDDIMTGIRALQRRGHILLDNEGFIIGVGGLSSIPTEHHLSIDGRRFWAWCAFDVIGIFGALQASGFARSVDPSTNDNLVVNFVRGVPDETGLKVFMADMPTGGSVCYDWCWRVRFFQFESSAEAWAQANGITGDVRASFVTGDESDSYSAMNAAQAGFASVPCHYRTDHVELCATLTSHKTFASEHFWSYIQDYAK
ncbi:hypothetical protein MY11210_007651 [Beauveria gryllotalpidicola]